MIKTRIEIKHKRTGKVLFAFEAVGNTIKHTVMKAVAQGVNLKGANLQEANLQDADLSGADLQYAGLFKANLRGADLDGAVLNKANIYAADLCCARLQGAHLRNAHLCSANLRGAHLGYADLYNADLSGADLRDANFVRTDLYGADLSGADIKGANLYGANFDNARLQAQNLEEAIDLPYIPLACPSDGAFVGWKKIENYLIKLLIPADAERCSSTGRKCRCSYAKVLDITTLDGKEHTDEVKNMFYQPAITYKVGELVKPDSYDPDRWNTCSHGIHFFINKQEAIDY